MRTEDLSHRLAVARGDEPADLVLAGGRVLSVFTGELLEDERGRRRRTASPASVRLPGREEFDAIGPDPAARVHRRAHAHRVHQADARRVRPGALPHGTTTVVVDPHEIANVFGLDGVRALLAWTPRECRWTYFVMVSSCVPGSPFESNGATVTAGRHRGLSCRGAQGHRAGRDDELPGASWPGEANALAKIEAARTVRARPHIDGHAPGLSGPGLNAYLAAGVRERPRVHDL